MRRGPFGGPTETGLSDAIRRRVHMRGLREDERLQREQLLRHLTGKLSPLRRVSVGVGEPKGVGQQFRSQQDRLVSCLRRFGPIAERIESRTVSLSPTEYLIAHQSGVLQFFDVAPFAAAVHECLYGANDDAAHLALPPVLRMPRSGANEATQRPAFLGTVERRQKSASPAAIAIPSVIGGRSRLQRTIPGAGSSARQTARSTMVLLERRNLSFHLRLLMDDALRPARAALPATQLIGPQIDAVAKGAPRAAPHTENAEIGPSRASTRPVADNAGLGEAGLAFGQRRRVASSSADVPSLSGKTQFRGRHVRPALPGE